MKLLWRGKTRVFILESLNSLATSIYFLYLFFFTREHFGFDDKANLGLAALHGLIYAAFSMFAGRYAQRRGYQHALKVGFTIMALSMAAGACGLHLGLHIAVLCAWSFGMAFTWPALEAMASTNESPQGLQRALGIYNLVWAASCSVAYFVGGALIGALGDNSRFWLPACLHGLQLLLLCRPIDLQPVKIDSPVQNQAPLALNPRPIAKAKSFLHMSWLANPFAYIAINSVVPVIPTLADRFSLPHAAVGVFCSIWFFGRFFSFAILWKWNGWHYRRSWFFAAYAGLIGGFLGVLLAPNLPLAVLAQLVFGFSIGLIYYSSLFYSMDAGDTHGEHGGFHEAALGIGIFAGPAAGALSLWAAPQRPDSGTWTVGALLVAGLLALAWVGWRDRGRRVKIQPP